MTEQHTGFDAGAPRRSRPIRWLAKAIEPIASPMAGHRAFPLWAILRHTGRTSGRAYSTPIVALKTPEGFMIPLPFGDATQWARNVFAAAGARLRFAGRDYEIAEPRIVEGKAADAHLPLPLRFVAGGLGLRQYVLVKRVSG